MKQRWEPDERDVLKVLTMLAGESRVYRLYLKDARPVVERLCADVDDVNIGMLLTSVMSALAQPARLGNPAHIEQLALTVLRELKA